MIISRKTYQPRSDIRWEWKIFSEIFLLRICWFIGACHSDLASVTICRTFFRPWQKRRHAVPEPWNAMPEPWNAMPERWNAMPERWHAMPECWHAVPKRRHAVPERRHAVPECWNAVPERRHAV